MLFRQELEQGFQSDAGWKGKVGKGLKMPVRRKDQE